MRLRFLLPRRGRAGSLRGLTARRGALRAALLVLVVVAAGCGGGGPSKQRPRVATPPGPNAAPVPAFAIGIDEREPQLLAPGPQPAAYRRVHDAVAALRPTYVRIQVNWSQLQPSAGAPPAFAGASDGCDRGLPPCAASRGLRDTLRAVRDRGWRPVILIYGTPTWAAEPARGGCQVAQLPPEALPPRLSAYRQFVRALEAFGREQQVDLPYWSSWNEPNLPQFLGPQRARCSAAAPSLAAAAYTRLAEALAAEVGVEHTLLGEAAGIDRRAHGTGAAELAADLPDDLVCGAAAWAQHAYVTAPREAGRRLDPVALADNAAVLGPVERALAGHGCGRPVPVWITETGVGNRSGGCRAMAAQLRAWRADPQVAAAFQYTVREDPLFPVGLADARLQHLYPAYAAWRTRGGGPCPTG